MSLITLAPNLFFRVSRTHDQCGFSVVAAVVVVAAGVVAVPAVVVSVVVVAVAPVVVVVAVVNVVVVAAAENEIKEKNVAWRFELLGVKLE